MPFAEPLLPSKAAKQRGAAAPQSPAVPQAAKVAARPRWVRWVGILVFAGVLASLALLLLY
jgi:hypothetical protein